MSCGLSFASTETIFERLETVDSIVAAGGLSGIELGLAMDLEGFLKARLKEEKKRDIWAALQLPRKEANEKVTMINKRYALKFKDLYEERKYIARQVSYH